MADHFQSFDANCGCLEQNSLSASVNAMEDRVREFLTTNRSMKFIMSICCVFVKDCDPNVKTQPPICLTTQAFEVHQSTTISKVLDMARKQLVNRIDTFESNGSDWVLHSLVNLDTNVYVLDPLNASSYHPMEPWIIKKRAVIYIKN